MAQSIACPECRTKLSAPMEVIGQTVRCTKCGSTFTASTSLSPYLEDLPPPPKNHRPFLLGGAVVAGLLLVTGLVLGFHFLNEETGPDRVGGGKLADSRDADAALDGVRPKVDLKLMTKSGTPIEILEGGGPDRLPPPGAEDALPRPGKDTPAPAKKKPVSLDDVTLSNIKWSVAPNQRQLSISYAFQNGASPAGRGYILKVRIDGSISDVPIDATWPDSGERGFILPATLSSTPGKLPKAEAWVECSIGAGIGQKVSNTVSTE